MKLSDICKVDWGNTSLTKASYIDGGLFMAVSAAGCDGRINHYEHNEDVPVLSAIGAQCGRMFFPNEKFTAIKNTITLTPKENVVGKYIYYLFSSIDLPKRGAGQPFISKGDIEKFEIPAIPSFLVQQKIVEKLDSIFTQIDKAIAVIDTNIRNAEALFQSYLTEIFENELLTSQKFEIQSICKFINGFAFKSSEAVAFSNTQLLRMGNLYGNSLDLTRSPVFYPDSFVSKYSKFVVHEGDILISLTGTVGKRDYGYAVKIDKLPINLLLNQRILKIYDIDTAVVDPDYFLRFLHSKVFLDELYKSANGTRQANLSSDYIKQMKIPLCSIVNQKVYMKKILQIQNKMLTIKESYKSKIVNLMKLREKILSQAFEGKLVKE